MEYTYNSMIFKDITICQLKNKGFRFGCDSPVLAWFTRAKKGWHVADCGSGSGVIAALIAKGYGAKVTAIEMQQEMFECLKQTVEICKLQDKINIINQDIRQISREKLYDAVVCNPPYRHAGTGKTAKDEVANKARFTLTMNIEDVVKFAKGSLKHQGRLFFSYDADMMIEALHICKINNLEPKRILTLHKDISSKAKLVFIECMLAGGKELCIEPPLFQQGTVDETRRYDNIFNGIWES